MPADLDRALAMIKQHGGRIISEAPVRFACEAGSGLPLRVQRCAGVGVLRQGVRRLVIDGTPTVYDVWRITNTPAEAERITATRRGRGDPYRRT
jgi:hypothetical protein